MSRQKRVSLENQVNSEEMEEGCILMGTGGELQRTFKEEEAEEKSWKDWTEVLQERGLLPGWLE